MSEDTQEITIQVLMHAEEEARSLGDMRLGTEHILLALLSFDNAVCCALSGFNLSYDDIRIELEDARSKQNALGPEVEIGMTARASKCVELAFLEAQSLKHRNVGPEHLMLAILRIGQGVAVGLLRKFGVRIVDLEIALLYQCSSLLAAPQEDVAAELNTQIEVWSRLALIAQEQGYEELVQKAFKYTRSYRDSLLELEAGKRTEEPENEQVGSVYAEPRSENLEFKQ